MMTKREKEYSLKRMEEVVAYWKAQHGVRAVAAFGSLAEIDRFDKWSDLDFLVICNESDKNSLLNALSGLEKLYSIAYIQIEYGDSIKLLFEDGILCDFGIVTEEQTFNFSHGQGRVLWCDSDFSYDCIKQNYMKDTFDEPGDWIGDVLIHTFVGILRQQRGEIAAAFEEIQIIAVKKLLSGIYKENGFEERDIFSPMRHAEKYIFSGDEAISNLMPGYSHNIEAAKEILKWLKNENYPEKLMIQVESILKEPIV